MFACQKVPNRARERDSAGGIALKRERECDSDLLKRLKIQNPAKVCMQGVRAGVCMRGVYAKEFVQEFMQRFACRGLHAEVCMQRFACGSLCSTSHWHARSPS